VILATKNNIIENKSREQKEDEREMLYNYFGKERAKKIMFWVFAIPEIGVLVLILSDIKGVFFNDKI
jgi:hypothetical protein